STDPTEARLWLSRPIHAAALVDLQEALIEALPVEQPDRVRLMIAPKKIVTLRLTLDVSAISASG
ncbi:MAG: hypothetical protein CUN53_17630, partial [Phototrophicales bacterium]